MWPMIVACSVSSGAFHASGQTLPATDQRAGPPRTLNTPRTFVEPASREDWQKRAQQVREQVLVSCGLWPLPEKTPLNARVLGRVERAGYSVENISIETYPGFYLGGNLYRPLGKGKGPFPGILNPHGHWVHGRLEDQVLGSIPARCINFALQGMVAFSYDMVGYNDTQFAPSNPEAKRKGAESGHTFATDPTNLLWNISLMGLQTWNSIRALDFLSALPDVDPNRLGCTGASGGGTQTFMLGAIEDRLAAQAPNVMVSHTMQGGCLCENAPGLRVDFFNVDIAASAAPRPQILVAASTDWTKTTMEVEGPALGKVYHLFGAEDHLRYVRLDFDHNYNQPSREQVYGWFGKWLRHSPDFSPIAEQPYKKEADTALRVFSGSALPADAVTAEQLIAYLIKTGEARRQALPPINPPLLEQYRNTWLPAWKQTLQVAFVDKGLLVQTDKITKAAEYTRTDLTLGRVGRGDRLPATHIKPRRDVAKTIAVLAHPEGRAGFLDQAGHPSGLAQSLVSQGIPVLLLDTFLTGSLAQPSAAKSRDYFKDYFPTYNRTDCQERVQDLITACAFAKASSQGRRVILCGSGRAGLWALLAAPAADAVAADCDALNSSDDHALLAQDLFVPGLRRFGAFQGVACLAATNPLLLHHTGQRFATDEIETCYRKMHVPELYRQETARVEDATLAEWVLKLNRL